MLVLALVSQKGGAGKSTLAVNLAALAATEGLRVGIVDLDPQATASAWLSMREKTDIQGATAHPPTLKATIERLDREGLDLVLVDTPPHHSTASAAAVRVANLTLVPARPSAFDLAAINDTAELVRQAGGRAGSVINAVPAGSNVATQAAEFLAQAGLPVLGQLGQRIGWQHAAASGRGIYETERHGNSAAELVELWNAINRTLT